MNARESLLRQLSANQFAMWELHVYLDTHPMDKDALAMYKNYKDKSSTLRAEYERMYGPLTIGSGSSTEWLADPWPWDYNEEVI